MISAGLGRVADLATLLLLPLLSDDIVAELDALVADVDGRPGDEFANIVLALSAERALEISVSLSRSGHALLTSYLTPGQDRHIGEPPGGWACDEITSSTIP